MADSLLGKVKTIIYFSVAYMLGLLVLFLTSLPFAIENGYTYGGLLTSMVLIGLFVLRSVCRILADIILEALAASSRMSLHLSQSSTPVPSRPFVFLSLVSA